MVGVTWWMSRHSRGHWRPRCKTATKVLDPWAALVRKFVNVARSIEPGDIPSLDITDNPNNPKAAEVREKGGEVSRVVLSRMITLGWEISLR